MKEFPLRQRHPAPPEWLDHFVELQLKELREETLTEEEQDFLDEVALAAAAIPGALESLVLARGLGGVEAPDIHRRELVVAAATPPNLFDAVRTAVEEGLEQLTVDADGSPLPVLRIDAGAGLAEACYQKGYTFTISRRGEDPETVTPLGGLFIALSALKTMTLTYDSGSKTISLSES